MRSLTSTEMDSVTGGSCIMGGPSKFFPLATMEIIDEIVRECSHISAATGVRTTESGVEGIRVWATLIGGNDDDDDHREMR